MACHFQASTNWVINSWNPPFLGTRSACRRSPVKGVQEEHFGFSPRKATFPPEALRAVLASVRPQIPPEAPRGRAALGCCSTWPQEASRGHSELRLKAYVCFWFLCTTCKESSVLLFLWFDLDWQLRLLLFFFFCGFNLSKVFAYRGRVQLPGRLFALCGLSIFIDI